MNDPRIEAAIAEINAMGAEISKVCLPDGRYERLLQRSIVIEVIRRHFAEPPTEKKSACPETIAYITMELDHDLREGLYDRIRWNNRAMMLVLNALLTRETPLRAKLRELANRWATQSRFDDTITDYSAELRKVLEETET